MQLIIRDLIYRSPHKCIHSFTPASKSSCLTENYNGTAVHNGFMYYICNNLEKVKWKYNLWIKKML